MHRYPARRCLLLGPDEIVFLAPPRIAIELPRGTRVSLFPLAEVRGRSLGLRWPIDGLVLAPDGRLGTSNEALGPVEFTADRPSLLAILPASALRAAVAALAGSERWP